MVRFRSLPLNPLPYYPDFRKYKNHLMDNPRDLKTHFLPKLAHACAQRHCLQQPKSRKDPKAHRLTDASTECGRSVRWTVIRPREGTECC